MAGNASSAPMAPARTPAMTSATQKLTPCRVSTATGVGADGIEADVADGDLTGEADENVEADADDGRERDKRQHERRCSPRP